MSYLRIFVHIVWRTHDNFPALSRGKRDVLFKHIVSSATMKHIHVIAIGRYVDHVHCLVSMGHDQAMSKVVQALKGESSRWANMNNLFRHHFKWAEEYYACSVSHFMLPKLIRYIARREEHHARFTWNDEVERFLSENGFVGNAKSSCYRDSPDQD